MGLSSLHFINSGFNTVSLPYLAHRALDRDATHNQVTVQSANIVTYYLTITNTGAAAATDVTVTDQIPDGLTLVSDSISNDGALGTDNRTITWSLGELGANRSATVSFKVTAPTITQASTWKNTGNVSSKEQEVTASNTVVAVGNPATDNGDNSMGNTSDMTPLAGLFALGIGALALVVIAALRLIRIRRGSMK